MGAAAKAVLCLCVCVCLSAWPVRGSHIPAEMNKTIQNLLQHYKITNAERFDGKPVFNKDPLSTKMEGKVLFMSVVLEVYEKLIDHMLKQLPSAQNTTDTSNDTPAPAAAAAAAKAEKGNEVRTQLKYLKGKISQLKTNRYQEQEKFLQEMKSLKHIQMDNRVIQSKALGELPWLYEEASVLFEEIKLERRRRRRRQARRGKTHPRA
ncbi:interferon gamma-like [Centropristis striata]|uniref:interferon gamma-like n=1 Tax=Centropristis striata TaxID=184440 RepID=UPI0027DF8004|nr:interferon gamma-like [Centropristis striata]